MTGIRSITFCIDRMLIKFILCFVVSVLLCGCGRKVPEYSEYFTTNDQKRFAEAIYEGDLDGISEIISTGFDVNTRGKGEMSFLLWAMLSNQYGAFELLLRNAAKLNAEVEGFRGRRHAAPISEFAALSNDKRYLRILLEYGLDPDLRIGATQRPIIFNAITNERVENLELLNEFGANLNIADSSGITPLSYAARLWHYECALTLIRSGADPHLLNEVGKGFYDAYFDYQRRIYGHGGKDDLWFDKVQAELESLGLDF